MSITYLSKNDLVIDCNATQETRELEEELRYAIETESYIRIEELLNRVITSQGHRIRPSDYCLEEAIRIDHDSLYRRLLGAPYFIKPTINCLNIVAYQNDTSFYKELVYNYRYLIEQFHTIDDSSLFTVIQHANLSLLRFILQQMRAKIKRECFDYFEENRQPNDLFKVEERRKRNTHIRRLLCEHARLQFLAENKQSESDSESE